MFSLLKRQPLHFIYKLFIFSYNFSMISYVYIFYYIKIKNYCLSIELLQFVKSIIFSENVKQNRSIKLRCCQSANNELKPFPSSKI